MEIVKNYKKLVFTEKALLELENEMYILPYSIGVENQVSPFSHIFNGTNFWILFSWPNAYICC